MNYKTRMRYGSPHMPDRGGAAPKQSRQNPTVGFNGSTWTVIDEFDILAGNAGWAKGIGAAAARMEEQRQAALAEEIEENNRLWRAERHAHQIEKHYGGGVW